MTHRRLTLMIFLTLAFLAAAGFGGRLLGLFGVAQARQSAQESTPQQAEQAPATAPAIKSETRAVRVDVIVTDKKGNYIHDLKANDFRVFEDNKQEPIVNFSFGANPNAPPAAQRHYLILFFDNSTMSFSDQPQARAAAAKFIDENAGPDRVMAVVEFGGSIRIVQNFTADPDRLKLVVKNIGTSAVSPNGDVASGAASNGAADSGGLSTAGSVMLNNSVSDFGAQSLLLAIRSMARNLASIPGRKSMILFTSGFALTPERQSELTATIDTCNKANVAVYPLDVRGLTTPMSFIPDHSPNRGSLALDRIPIENESLRSTGARLVLATVHPSSPSGTAFFQHGGGGGGHGGGGGTGGGGTGGGGTGGGGGKGGGTGGGGTGGGKGGGGGSGGGTRGNPGGTYGNANYNQPRSIVPPFPPSAAINQQLLYELAEGTGGFPILNTNDLFAGLQKIAREQNEYYLLGYVPSNSAEGTCHTLKVKVEGHGANVRARSGYCNGKPVDVLAGKPIEKELETRAAASASTTTAGGSLEAPFFYTSANEARVNLAMEIPSSSIDFAKVKGKYHADVNVLGIAYRADGSVASRFSDEINMDFEKEEWQKFTQSPMRYQNQFSIVPGKYRLDVVLSGGGQKFGKYETPLVIEPYDGKSFSLSGVALSNQMRRVSDSESNIEADLLADRLPMIVQGVELTPSGTNHFKKTDRVVLYAQVYDPRLTDPNPPTIGCQYVVIDQKTGKQVLATGGIPVANFVQKGNPMIPLALKIPVDNFPPGEYRLEMQAGEAGGAVSQVRTVTFTAE